MKGNGSAKITELTVNISFSQSLTVGREGKKKPQTKQIKGIMDQEFQLKRFSGFIPLNFST